MTHELIEMARQAGATEIGHEPPAFHFYLEDLEAFAKLVAAKHDPKIAIADAYRAGVDSGIAAEREACAKLCEESSHPFGYANLTAEVCAKAIRARGNT